MELTVRMLAEAARSVGGKLYVFGGQWNSIMVPAVPTSLPLAIVLVIRTDYHEALQQHDLQVELVDEDGQPTGIKLGGQFEVGHPPGTREGQPGIMQLAIEPPPIPLERFGRFVWRITIDGNYMGTLPMEVQQADPQLPGMA